MLGKGHGLVEKRRVGREAEIHTGPDRYGLLGAHPCVAGQLAIDILPQAAVAPLNRRQSLRLPLAAPALGQDTDRILGELGYSAENIENLRRAGVVS